MTPTPIPAFALVLKPQEEHSVVSAVAVGDNDSDELVVVGALDEMVVDFAVILEDARVVGELDMEVNDTVASRTRNPGLDKSAVFGLYVEAGTLNRKTYFALTARLLSGIAIVHA